MFCCSVASVLCLRRTVVAHGHGVDDLIEVLAQSVADPSVGERPLCHALADAGEQLMAVRVGAPVAQRDEVERVAVDRPGLG